MADSLEVLGSSSAPLPGVCCSSVISQSSASSFDSTCASSCVAAGVVLLFLVSSSTFALAACKYKKMGQSIFAQMGNPGRRLKLYHEYVHPEVFPLSSLHKWHLHTDCEIHASTFLTSAAREHLKYAAWHCICFFSAQAAPHDAEQGTCCKQLRLRPTGAV